MAKYRVCTVGYDIGSKYITGWGERFTYIKNDITWWDHEKTYIENIAEKLDQINAFGTYTYGYVAKDLDELKTLCYKVTSITHNSDEALKGAEAVASCIFLARKGYSKTEIEKFVTTHYYKLDYNLEDLQKYYKTYLNCNQSVPQAIYCFLISKDFEDAIKTAISIGGDSDTIACITGSIASQFYPVRNSVKEQCFSFLTDDLKKIFFDFEQTFIQ
jgi:ADP-ribosylglycohydrolase